MNKPKWPILVYLVFIMSISQTVFTAELLRAKDIEAKWSTSGPLPTPFHNCVQINEPSDPQSTLWDDNYLCFNRPDHGFRYSVSGPISGMRCANLDIKGDVWADNYLCSDNVKFAWFARKLGKGYKCIRLVEPADPHPRANNQKWNNAFCIKK